MEAPGGTGIKHSVKADDHAEALPESWVIRWRHLQTGEECARPEACPKTKGNVVERRESEDQTVKFCSVGTDHTCLFILSNNRWESESMIDSTTGARATMIAACDKLHRGWLFW